MRKEKWGFKFLWKHVNKRENSKQNSSDTTESLLIASKVYQKLMQSSFTIPLGRNGVFKSLVWVKKSSSMVHDLFNKSGLSICFILVELNTSFFECVVQSSWPPYFDHFSTSFLFGFYTWGVCRVIFVQNFLHSPFYLLHFYLLNLLQQFNAEIFQKMSVQCPCRQLPSSKDKISQNLVCSAAQTYCILHLPLQNVQNPMHPRPRILSKPVLIFFIYLYPLV